MPNVPSSLSFRRRFSNTCPRSNCAPRYLRVTLATFSWIPHPASPKSNVDDIYWVPINFRQAHPINHAFGSVRNRLVSFRQKFGQNWKILYWILRTFRVCMNIDNVGRRMPDKILLEGAPSVGKDPAAGIETGDRSAEDITREREGCDVAAGRTSVSVQIDFWGLTPDENPVRRCRMREQVSSRLRRDA